MEHFQISPFNAVQSDGRTTLKFSAKYTGILEVYNPGQGGTDFWVYFPVILPSNINGKNVRIVKVNLHHGSQWGPPDLLMSYITELEVRQVTRFSATRILFLSGNQVPPSNINGFAIASAGSSNSPIL